MFNSKNFYFDLPISHSSKKTTRSQTKDLPKEEKEHVLFKPTDSTYKRLRSVSILQQILKQIVVFPQKMK